jgi:hypothetical protein
MVDVAPPAFVEIESAAVRQTRLALKVLQRAGAIQSGSINR